MKKTIPLSFLFLLLITSLTLAQTARERPAKIFDVQNKRFSTVTCSRCKFTEIYRADSSTLGNVFDFFTN